MQAYLVETAEAIALVNLVDAVEEAVELALVALADVSSKPAHVHLCLNAGFILSVRNRSFWLHIKFR